MLKKLIDIAALILLVNLYSCSTTQQADSPQQSKKTAHESKEAIPMKDSDVAQVVPREEAPPAPAPSQSVVFVESDLRKEFPKSQHIRIGKQLGIDIKDIYYYNNRSRVFAIYVDTDTVENESVLKEIQATIHKIFWDFDRGNITTFFSSADQLYAISASKKEYGVTYTVIYDYEDMKKEFSQMIAAISETENYPFSDQPIYGIFIRPIYLNHQEESNLKEMSLYYIVKEEEGHFKQYSASKQGIYMKNPISLYLDQEGYFHNYQYGNTIRVDQNGNLLSHDNESNFQEKHTDFLLKIL